MPDTCPFSSPQIAEALATLQQSPSKKIDNGFLMLHFWRDCIKTEIKLSKSYLPYLQHHRQHVFRAEMR